MGLAVGGALAFVTHEKIATFDLFISFAHAFHVASKEDVKLHQKLTQAESCLVSKLFFQMGHCKKKKILVTCSGLQSF